MSPLITPIGNAFVEAFEEMQSRLPSEVSVYESPGMAPLGFVDFGAGCKIFPVLSGDSGSVTGKYAVYLTHKKSHVILAVEFHEGDPIADVMDMIAKAGLRLANYEAESAS